MNKTEATKYILKKFCDWYYELNPSKKATDENDLSILKVLKLIFFLCTVNHNGQSLLGNPFNNFKAMPLGPVESDVYEHFKATKQMVNYSKTNSDKITYTLDQSEITLIDNLVTELKSKNFDLINKSAFYLVDLTHEWSCWIEKYAEAERNNNNSIEMTTQDIIESTGRSYTF